MAPAYKLTYFAIRGRAEHLRLMFHFAKVPYEDVKIDAEQWKELKPKTPFGQLPVLEIDGVMVEQSVALARYLAKQFGLDGKDDMERLQADVFVAHIEDIRNQFSPYIREQDPAKKEAILKNLRSEVLPAFFEKFDKRIVKNGGFTGGKTILWSDILLFGLLEAFEIRKVMPDGYAEKYPNMMKVKNAVANTPQIKSYLEKRPHTDI